MRKSNWLIAAILVLASIFFLWLWFYLGFNLVDNPLDLVVSIIWWAVVAGGCYCIHQAEQKRQERVRTTYVAPSAVFNSEAGLVDLNGASAVEGIQQVLEGLEYNFDIKDFPSNSEAKFDYIVRSTKFEVEKGSEQGATGSGDATTANGASGATGSASSQVKTWEGEVVRVAAPDEEPREFTSKEQLEAILAA